jgi:hypothetical protein
MMLVPSTAPLTEPIAVQDIYCSGLARIEDLGSCLRFTFYASQRPICGDDHDIDRVVVARLVLSKEATSAAALMALTATDTSVYGHPTH